MDWQPRCSDAMDPLDPLDPLEELISGVWWRCVHLRVAARS